MFRLSPVALAFFAWFAIWFVAGRYISVDFYRFALGEAAQAALGLMTLLVALALVIVRFLSPQEQRSPRWSYALLCIGLLAIVELTWRLVMNDLHWDTVKGVGIVLGVSTPALLALGVAAVLSEWRVSRPKMENGTLL